MTEVVLHSNMLINLDPGLYKAVLLKQDVSITGAHSSQLSVSVARSDPNQMTNYQKHSY